MRHEQLAELALDGYPIINSGEPRASRSRSRQMPFAEELEARNAAQGEELNVSKLWAHIPLVAGICFSDIAGKNKLLLLDIAGKSLLYLKELYPASRAINSLFLFIDYFIQRVAGRALFLWIIRIISEMPTTGTNPIKPKELNPEDEVFEAICLDKLNMQITLLLESRARIAAEAQTGDFAQRLASVVAEYRDVFCDSLQQSLSTQRVLSQLNYIQNQEGLLRQLRVIGAETHQNLQMRDILFLSKQKTPLLRTQIERIRGMQMESELDSDWMADRFVSGSTAKVISKTRNALIRFLNDHGIGKVDFKVVLAAC